MAYRYLGNKTRISEWIVDSIAELASPTSTVADLMCGTASVSASLASRGFRVVAADQLKFPTLHAKARLNFHSEKWFNRLGMTYREAVNTLNELPPQEGYFYNEFGVAGQPSSRTSPRRYFSATNAGVIDSIRDQLRSWRALTQAHDACDLLLHDLILAVNKVANITGTYGYFRANLGSNAEKNLEIRQSARARTGSHSVIHGSVFETVMNVNCDVLYLDPPYTKRQYAGNYHIPETIAMEDFPVAQGDGGLRPWKDMSSPFCYRRKALDAIHKVMRGTKAPLIFWSYSDDGQVQLDDFVQALSTYGSVKVKQTEISRFRSNENTSKDLVQEYLLICTR